MVQQNFAEFLHLFDEWKEIIDRSNTDAVTAAKAKSNIDKILHEIDESKTERDFNEVKTLMRNLEGVPALSKFVTNSYDTVLDVVYNK
jgi:uncharacterized protein YpiB (UPF0302 family)